MKKNSQRGKNYNELAKTSIRNKIVMASIKSHSLMLIYLFHLTVRHEAVIQFFSQHHSIQQSLAQNT